MLCINCKNAKDEIDLKDEEFEKVKALFATKEDYVKFLEKVKTDMAKSFKVVKWCTIRQAIVVGNQGIPTQSIIECNNYTPTSEVV